MKAKAISANEWLYPDIFEYESVSDSIKLASPRNSYAAVQIQLTGVQAGGASIKASGKIQELPLESYELVAVPVEDNPRLKKEDAMNGCPSRWAPYEIYDCAKPFTKAVTPKNGAAGLYLAFAVAPDVKPGLYDGVVEIKAGGETASLPVTVKVYKAAVPAEETLKMVNGYYRSKVEQYHKVKAGTPEFKALDKKYLAMLRRMRQNTLYMAAGPAVKDLGKGRYSFDFADMKKEIKSLLALGFTYFLLPGIGWRESWKKPTINVVVGGVQFPAMSYEAYNYLSQYLPALNTFLEKNGWAESAFQQVSDEPNNENATEYRALCGMIRKLAPGLRLIDAVSYVPVHGALDIWVPLNSEYDKHRKEFESFRGANDELWHYVCCSPRSEGYINRFMDYPLLATRYLFWGNYKYNLSGYLHWAANCWQPGQDPFKQNCPEHRNTDNQTILPAGDSHIIYPGEGAPWLSMRLEAHRASACDYELLALLAKKDKIKADAICARGFKSFNKVEYKAATFEAVLEELYEALS
jgi:hypothetical protein